MTIKKKNKNDEVYTFETTYKQFFPKFHKLKKTEVVILEGVVASQDKTSSRIIIKVPLWEYSLGFYYDSNKAIIIL